MPVITAGHVLPLVPPEKGRREPAVSVTTTSNAALPHPLKMARERLLCQPSLRPVLLFRACCKSWREAAVPVILWDKHHPYAHCAC